MEAKKQRKRMSGFYQPSRIFQRLSGLQTIALPPTLAPTPLSSLLEGGALLSSYLSLLSSYLSLLSSYLGAGGPRYRSLSFLRSPLLSSLSTSFTALETSFLLAPNFSPTVLTTPLSAPLATSAIGPINAPKNSLFDSEAVFASTLLAPYACSCGIAFLRAKVSTKWSGLSLSDSDWAKPRSWIFSLSS